MTRFPDLRDRTILQVIPALDAGGAERTTVEMAEAVVKAGGRALVVSRGGRLARDLERTGGELVKLDAATKSPWGLLRLALALETLIRSEEVDLVHARSRAPAWCALRAARRTGAAFVTTYHGAYSGGSGLKRRYNSVMARGDFVIANSDWTASHVRAVHGVPDERLRVVPRGVDPNLFSPASVTPARVRAVRQAWGLKPSGGERVLLLPGRLTPWKGQRVAIDALAAIEAAERRGLMLVLTGDAQGRDRYVAELRGQISALGLESAVRVAPHTDDMPAALAAADIVLTPSTRPEAFGRVAAEAGAMSRPVIASDHGGALEIIVHGETGLRIAPGDPAALAGALMRLLSMDPSARAAMGEKGRRRVAQRFSKSQLQAKTLAVYKDALTARNATTG